MPTTKGNRKTTGHTTQAEPAEAAKEMTRDVIDYMTEYARENPGYAALMCLGVGFVLGWKLKPW